LARKPKWRTTLQLRKMYLILFNYQQTIAWLATSKF
jgi:hypothetical protein